MKVVVVGYSRVNQLKMFKKKSCTILLATLVISFIQGYTNAKSPNVLLSRNVSESSDWWKTAVFYQIYPRSWMDSDGDGNGDLKGITNRLEHLKDAGVTATWLSPIFKSPKADQGYDISDYRTIDPMFGTNADFEALLGKAKEIGIKIILDFVPNHTSDEHEWFQKSVSKEEGYEDFYIWHDGKIEDGERTVPNNWISSFGGSAWTWNKERQQYYYHEFYYKQPDLNYSNPKVVDAMKAVLTYWLDQGVDGFRVDAVPFLFEEPEFKDEPLASEYSTYNVSDWNCLNHLYTKDLDPTFDIIYQFRELLDAYSKTHEVDTKVMMTEAYSPVDKQMLYYGTSDGRRLGAHFTFNFNFITNLNINFTVDDIIDAVELWQANLPKRYTSNWVLGNHDNRRMPTRLGKENIDAFNMLTATLPGVMVTYTGEEFGMEDGEVNCTDSQDPQANCSNYEAVSRDFERTPFQWDNTKNAGFSTSDKTWLPVSEKYLENNLALQSEEGTDSHYHVYKSLLVLRQKLANIVGDSLVLTKLSDTVLQVTRLNPEHEFILLFNTGEKENSFKFLRTNDKFQVVARSVGSSFKIGDSVNQHVTLRGHESIIIENTS